LRSTPPPAPFKKLLCSTNRAFPAKCWAAVIKISLVSEANKPMPRLKRTVQETTVDCLWGRSAEAAVSHRTPFDPGLLAVMKQIAGSELTPSSALDLLTRLIAEVPTTSKEGMEQIKMMDKLLNTAKAIMETRLKNEEAAEIANRLEEMENRLERLAAEKGLANKRPMEVWNGTKLDK
jgi:hypothetical protein